ncbi:hypothetical protein AVEN_187457-1 [Araneus ventricosus]|uniref:Uncharacterized protein n=1 Tax=Araneus ventricosus TaxID=182803 RepID=A0A4Y2BRX0_ARAVE|nr:hypothetical protein AVEN_187457-1 [Araneus ventricosus]
MNKQFEKLFAMMAEMKAGQEEMRVAQAGFEQKTEAGQAGSEQKMEAGQEEMRSGQERMEKGQEEMKGLIDDLKGEVQRKIDEVEEKVHMMVEDVKSEVKGRIEEVEHKVQGKIERRFSELEDRPFSFLASPEFMHPGPTVKSLTFDGQTSWTVFKTQFSILRGSAAEFLQEIPADKLTDITTIEKALESRFGDSHLTQFYRTELKTRRQKLEESLQVLATDVERLISLEYTECPLDVQESLAVQFFVDVIRDEETQLSTRLMDFMDLKSDLAYSIKFESAQTALKFSIHEGSIETEDDTWEERDDKFESLLKALEKLVNSLAAEQNVPWRNPNVTCWKCFKKGHVQ